MEDAGENAVSLRISVDTTAPVSGNGSPSASNSNSPSQGGGEDGVGAGVGVGARPRVARLETVSPRAAGTMGSLRYMHKSIQDTISEIQGKTSRILQDQERDLLRSFRARLTEVADELEKEKRKNESGSVEWVQKCRKLQEELDWLRSLSEKLTEENKMLVRDNRKFKRQMRTQEEDREFLIKQLVTVKKENARLRQSLEELKAQSAAPPPEVRYTPMQFEGGADGASNDGEASGGRTHIRRSLVRPSSAAVKAPRPSTSAPNGERKHSQSTALPPRPSTGMGFLSPTSPKARPATAFRHSVSGVASDHTYTPPAQAAAAAESAGEERYKNLVVRLKKQLETEQQKVRSLQQQCNGDLSRKNELLALFRRCIDDVRANAEHTAVVAGRGEVDLVKLSQFRNLSATDRWDIISNLLKSEEVVHLLEASLFPPNTKAASVTSKSGETPRRESTVSLNGRTDH